MGVCMAHRRSTDMSFGTALENGCAWGLPASPLFLAILMMLAHAPYAAPIVEPALFYLVCIAGTVVSLVGCAALRTWNQHGVQILCWIGAVVLEASWLTMLWGEYSASHLALLIGTFLVGLSTSTLLVLWLSVGQTPSVTCEICKIAVAFAAAFVLYSLFSVIPHAGAISYFFPILTCVPLSFFLRREHFERSSTAQERPALSAALSPRVMATTCLLAVLGMGFVVLGFGGAHVEQGAGLATIALAGCLLLRNVRDPLTVLRQVPMPLAVFSMCYAFLFSSGNPFAFLLAACGTLVIWLYLAPRFDGQGIAPMAPRRIAVLLAWIMVFAGLGVVAGQALAHLNVPTSTAVVLVILLAVSADFVWRIAVMVPPSHAPAISPRDGSASDASLLEQSFGLSPRETQVAVLLCENRSVSYVCSSLNLTTSTTKTHIRHIYEKTGVHSRSELQLLAEHLADQDPSSVACTS